MARSSVRYNRADTQAYSRAAYYVDGNTVRKTETQALPRRREHRRTEAVTGTREAARARRAQAELSIDLPFLALLTVAVVITFFLCFHYLRLSASIDAHMDRIERLETELENLRTENDALEQSIDTSIDLNYVYRVATEELGMIRAGKDNIIGYDKTESEYVRQNEDIPRNQ